jgi:hypothetical protein
VIVRGIKDVLVVVGRRKAVLVIVIRDRCVHIGYTVLKDDERIKDVLEDKGGSAIWSFS